MMKKFLIFMTILCSGYYMSQTQLELNEIAEKKYEKTWNELNVLQNKLLLKYKTQKEMTNKILTGHKIWIQKRDNHMKLINKEGSFFPVRWYNELTYLTKMRIEYLKDYFENTLQ